MLFFSVNSNPFSLHPGNLVAPVFSSPIQSAVALGPSHQSHSSSEAAVPPYLHRASQQHSSQGRQETRPVGQGPMHGETVSDTHLLELEKSAPEKWLVQVPVERCFATTIAFPQRIMGQSAGDS